MVSRRPHPARFRRNCTIPPRERGPRRVASIVARCRSYRDTVTETGAGPGWSGQANIRTDVDRVPPPQSNADSAELVRPGQLRGHSRTQGWAIGTGTPQRYFRSGKILTLPPGRAFPMGIIIFHRLLPAALSRSRHRIIGREHRRFNSPAIRWASGDAARGWQGSRHHGGSNDAKFSFRTAERRF